MLEAEKYYRKFKLNIARFVTRNFFWVSLSSLLEGIFNSSPKTESSALEGEITFNHNYSFRAVVIIGATIDVAVDAIVVGGITADGLTADLAAKLFRALSLLE